MNLVNITTNHLKIARVDSQGKSKYRVSTDDLDILIANWQVQDGPNPNCP